MNCPKCNSLMEKVQYKSIEVDRCTNCKGIWFDMLEHEDLKSLEGSEKSILVMQKLAKNLTK